MAAPQKNAIKRLMFDLEELQKSPVANVSAAPLDDNMFEWHCNIRQDETIFHLILFFPQNYPYESPSAEFVPVGFQYNSGATQSGKKGTKICLNIFSDFAYIHTEWANEKGVGWSPGYTVQTILMNVVAFLAETQASGGYSGTYNHNLKMSQGFTCADCGHTYKNPSPALDEDAGGDAKKPAKKGAGAKGKGKGKAAAKPSSSKTNVSSGVESQIVDYISKEEFENKKPASVDDLFGYGLVVSGPKHRPSLTTPCEFLMGRSFFGMKKSVKVVHSVLKEELAYFLPLFISTDHGSQIKSEFEKTLMSVAEILPKCNPKKTPMAEMIIKTIPNLMSATVVEFSKGTQHTSDNSLNGYFALHRLMLWALETYPDLQPEVESRLQKFIASEDNRTKKACPHIGELLMLLAASQKYKWQDLADAYLSESWRRNVMWYVKEDSKLGFLDTPQEYRLENTLTRTAVSRKILAFQVLFLDIAMPSGMSRKDIIKRYDTNLGFPTADMVTKMKDACANINSLKTYGDWFKVLKIPSPSDDQIYNKLVEAVKFAILTDGYHWSFWKTGGGWGEVLRKYADMKKAHKESLGKGKGEKGEKSGKDEKGEKSDKADEETPMETDEKPADAKKKGAKAARGRGASRGASAARGRKRKSEDAELSGDSDDDTDTSAKAAPKKAARGRGRGRGRGASAKRGR